MSTKPEVSEQTALGYYESSSHVNNTVRLFRVGIPQIELLGGHHQDEPLTVEEKSKLPLDSRDLSGMIVESHMTHALINGQLKADSMAGEEISVFTRDLSYHVGELGLRKDNQGIGTAVLIAMALTDKDEARGSEALQQILGRETETTDEVASEQDPRIERLTSGFSEVLQPILAKDPFGMDPSTFGELKVNDAGGSETVINQLKLRAYDKALEQVTLLLQDAVASGLPRKQASALYYSVKARLVSEARQEIAQETSGGSSSAPSKAA